VGSKSTNILVLWDYRSTSLYSKGESKKMQKELDKETLEELRDGAQDELDYETQHGADRHELKDVPYWIGFWCGKAGAYQFLLDTYKI